MDEVALIRQFVAGLSVAVVLFLAAVGLQLIWGVLRIMNFATGSIYMLGAYVALTATRSMGTSSLAFFLILLGVPVLIGVIGAVIEVTVLRRTYPREDKNQQFMLTLALSYLVTGGVIAAYGTGFHAIDPPELLSGRIELLGVVLPVYRIFMIGVGLVMGAGIWLLLKKTRLGLLTRAAAADREMASALGVNVRMVYTFIFAIGVATGAMSGVLIAPTNAINPNMHNSILVPAFVVAVAGGLGSIAGAWWASVAIGMLQSYSTLVTPSVSPMVPYAVMAAILFAKPLIEHISHRLQVRRAIRI